MSTLHHLGKLSKLVADTGDLDSIRELKPIGATTNPTLVLAAVNDPKFADLVDKAIKSAKGDTLEARVTDATDRLAVAFGVEITRLVPGYVSTELDARLSFDIKATIAKAHKIMALYEEQGVSKDRVLLKIASTWEGIQAGEALEKMGVNCNMTLLFNFHQAVACAQAGAHLVSPYVGRIKDYYEALEGRTFTPEEDPGVVSVRKIYNYYKKHGHKSLVMAASFRSVGECLALAGCDRLTVSPKLLNEMDTMTDPVTLRLSATEAMAMDIPEVCVTEQSFRWQMNEDAMATQQLAAGISKFAADLGKLEAIVRARMAGQGG